MSTVLAGIAAFSLIILVLTGVLLLARATLVASGPISVRLNGGEKSIRGTAGDTLLATLTQAGLYLPAACGGQGTCGACRVLVGEGAGVPLPTEAVHISGGDARLGWRLACQVKLKQDLEVELPPSVLSVRQWRCTVRAAENVATFIRQIVFDLPDGEEIDFKAGEYVLVECPPYRQRFADFDISEPYRAEWTRYALWDIESESSQPASRAYSLANAPSEKRVLMLNVRIATPPAGTQAIPPGVVSTYLFGLRPGDPVTVTGPFGDFVATESEAEMVFVGGGAGMAPMRSHILDQLERIGSRRKISFWYGARSRQEAFYEDLFDRLAAEHGNFDWYLALSDPSPDDSWDGPIGFIHQVLYENYLREHPAPEDVEYYLCGPPAMIGACRKMLDGLGVEPSNIRYDDFGS